MWYIENVNTLYLAIKDTGLCSVLRDGEGAQRHEEWQGGGQRRNPSRGMEVSGMVWSRHSRQAVQQHNDHGDHTISLEEKGGIQECKNFRGIKLLTHTFKIWERVLDRRVRECTDIHESQFGFMPGRSTTDATFILKQTIEQYRQGQKDICVTFIDLEKAYDRVPREEIWRTMRERLASWCQKNMSSWSKTCTLDAEQRCAQSREKAANSMLRLAYTRGGIHEWGHNL